MSLFPSSVVIHLTGSMQLLLGRMTDQCVEAETKFSNGESQIRIFSVSLVCCVCQSRFCGVGCCNSTPTFCLPI